MPNYSKKYGSKYASPIEFHSLEWSTLASKLAGLSESLPKPDLITMEDFTGENVREDDYEDCLTSFLKDRNLKNALTLEKYKKAEKARKAAISSTLNPFKRVGVIPELLRVIGRFPVVFSDTLNSNGDKFVDVSGTTNKWAEMAKNGSLTFLNGSSITFYQLLGMIAFCRHPNRSELMHTKLTESEYNPTVPLILMALKKYQGIKYSQFERETNLYKLLDPIMASLLKVDYTEDFEEEALAELHLRVRGLPYTYMKLALSEHQPFNDAGYTLDFSPRAFLAQCWVYSPELYSEYSLVNRDDFDTPVKPLVAAEKPSSRLIEDLINNSKGDIPW